MKQHLEIISKQKCLKRAVRWEKKIKYNNVLGLKKNYNVAFYFSYNLFILGKNKKKIYYAILLNKNLKKKTIYNGIGVGVG